MGCPVHELDCVWEGVDKVEEEYAEREGSLVNHTINWSGFSTLKAKMKSADSIYSAVNLPEQNVFLACSELNQIALGQSNRYVFLLQIVLYNL